MQRRLAVGLARSEPRDRRDEGFDAGHPRRCSAVARWLSAPVLQQVRGTWRRARPHHLRQRRSPPDRQSTALSRSDSMMTRTPKRYVVIMVVAVLALASPLLWQTLTHKSAKDRIEADPPPRLFASKSVAPLADDIDAQR